ncbi:Golgi apparatus membrane protein TVP38 [Ceratobasidium sp. AG-Ba]|nr:Golgi apparatus membrane protein TVP38 [Ceratobasidium sp. AG-Ba]
MTTHPHQGASSTTLSPPHGQNYLYSARPSFQDHDSAPLTGRNMKRASSPTPSEKEELKEYDGILSKMFRKDSWKDRSFLIGFAVLVFILTITVLVGVFQDKIVKALLPAAGWVRKTPGGWLIPICILTALSIPPLFGAEIVHVLCGITYGLGIGFLIVCAGTIIGESITFFLFRSCLRSRAEKMERGTGGNPRLGALARVIREGGFPVALVARYSAFPTHIVTALFSVCGISFWMFTITLVLSLPLQLAGVYIGVLAKEAAEGRPSKVDKILSTVILVVTIVVTVIAMHWIQYRLKASALQMIRERRARMNASGDIDIEPFDPSMLYDPEAARARQLSNEAGLREARYPPN